VDITELLKKPHLSASAINDYIDCGLLYRFGRIEKLPPEFKADALEFGTVIHKVLADFYLSKMMGDKLLLKELHALFEKYWRKAAEGRTDIKYAEGKDFEILLSEGKELLTVYYDKLPEDSFETIAIEEGVGFYVDDMPVVGFIDLLQEDESGTLIVTDWKTSGRAYSTEEVNKNLQVTLYAHALKQNGYQDREILLKFDCLIKTKKPKFEQYYTTRTEQDVKRTITKIRHVWEGISKGVFVPNDTSWKCAGCSYQAACKDYLEGNYDQAA
jgi:putative RecB family exonuclease